MEILSFDTLALAFFLICLLLSIYFRERARRMEIVTGKKIRSYYRHNWIENVIKKDNIHFLLETIRNNILVSSGMITALVIAFGFVVGSDVGTSMNGNFVADARILLSIALLVYSFFMIILEVRTLIYIPIVFGTSEKLIIKYEGMKKVDYLAKLIHEAFDHFFNAIRALFFIVALLIWFYNLYAFVLFTVLISYVMVREDFGTNSKITIF